MKPPKYVKFKDSNNPCCLEFDGTEYHRAAGAWWVTFKITRNRIFIDGVKGHGAHLNGKELVKCSEKEWQQDNAGYTED